MNKKTTISTSSSKSYPSRFFFDASSIFALIECGYFYRFCDLIPNFYITTQVQFELTKKEKLPKKVVSESITSGKITVITLQNLDKVKWKEYKSLGLGTGEISILLTARKKKDIVVFDDLVARSVARAEGFSLIGLLGILVKLKKTSKISKKEALSILSSLNQTNFRMSSALFESVLRKLNEK